ncbi:MAG TPA: radical SAM protein [Myxococcota bacterium]|nr:radical SAM protein [Myxococcota bacterium]HQK50100.1 radical SAM protein [Myxococcota bacterium]
MKVPGTPPAIIGVTQRCNQRCVFCLDADRRGESDPSLESLLADFDTLARRGVREAVLMTGESVLRPDFPEILKGLEARGIRPTLTTNGTLLADERRLERLVALGLRHYNVSVHAVDEDLAGRISGRAWTWPRQRQALANLDQAARRGEIDAVYTKTVLVRLNLGVVHEVVRVLGEMLSHVRELTLGVKQAVPVRAAHRELLVPLDQVGGALGMAAAEADRLTRVLLLDGFPLCALPGLEDRSRELQDLARGRTYIEVEGRSAEADPSLWPMARKSEACRGCPLDPICPGVHGAVIHATGGPLRASRQDPERLLRQAWERAYPPIDGPCPSLEDCRRWTRSPTLEEAPIGPEGVGEDPVLRVLAELLQRKGRVGDLRVGPIRLTGDRMEGHLVNGGGEMTFWIGARGGPGEAFLETETHRLGYLECSLPDPGPSLRMLGEVLRRMEERLAPIPS